MAKNKYLTTIALVLTVLAISAASVFAATDSATTADITKALKTPPTQEEMQAKFEEMKVNHEEVNNAILAGDYDAWYSLMTEDGKTPKILDVIDEDNFAKFSEAHQLMKEGREILEDLGVDKGMGRGDGMKGGFGGNGVMRGHGPSGTIPSDGVPAPQDGADESN